MDGIAGTLAAAAGMFAGTNIDDIIVLTVLFLSWRANAKPRPWQIWAGQYTGIAVLVLVSVVAALGLTIVPEDWVGLLGFIPFALGVKGLVSAFRARGDGQDTSSVVASGVASVAGVTIANGADNISVYTPVFRTIGTGPTLVTIAVFAIGVALWCAAGSWLGSHRKIIDLIERYGHLLVPVVFMTIGIVIVVESGVIAKIS
ncbi:cadmium resistance transport/sequestration family protein [Nonomuraea polychroma]|uniref:Cadmium resistance transport/sequestration family protein n=1 Tax=Nonomuraea polychroma TaxID=46176 RepID=A0A438MPA2_9ACTN|nr:cadmium resistance transporter [Nonomuraea polychroma]RVX47658.1 cadmium resistance transport/sequestration family protein [Nonomuraea polychroma]